MLGQPECHCHSASLVPTGICSVPLLHLGLARAPLAALISLVLAPGLAAVLHRAVLAVKEWGLRGGILMSTFVRY